MSVVANLIKSKISNEPFHLDLHCLHIQFSDLDLYLRRLLGGCFNLMAEQLKEKAF